MTHRYRLWVVEVAREVHEDVGDELRDVVGKRVDEGAEADHAGVSLAHALSQLGLTGVPLGGGGVLGLLQLGGGPLAEVFLEDAYDLC